MQFNNQKATNTLNHLFLRQVFPSDGTDRCPDIQLTDLCLVDAELQTFFFICLRSMYRATSHLADSWIYEFLL